MEKHSSLIHRGGPYLSSQEFIDAKRFGCYRVFNYFKAPPELAKLPYSTVVPSAGRPSTGFAVSTNL